MATASNYVRTRVKFCGVTRAGDIRLAGELGADAVGFVFAERSVRRVTPEAARALRDAVGPMLTVVALFMDNTTAEIEKAISALRPNLLQFHGGENEAECRRWGLPYLKAVPMLGRAGAPEPLQLLGSFPTAGGFLFDGHAAGEPGGGGRRFDWAQLPSTLGRPWLLAGGLDPDNVAEAVTRTRPWGVDVSSGIESAPGVKDGERMKRFLEEVRRADCTTDG
ncbi:MAG: phosphoribosylanthranilate isomerase [Lysobacteraceae bacterium]